MTVIGPNAGCVQWLEEPNGDVLIPVFYHKMNPKKAAETNRDAFEVDNWMKSDDFGLTTMIVRCRFDGDKLTYVEHGDELGMRGGRGVYEPSITRFGKNYYLTLRADKTGYVARSRDGLRYEPLKEWKFDDGTELGSYNTQQHWVTHSGGLYLVYTRRGANNDHVFRHRAPLFIARVDPENLTVLRATERGADSRGRRGAWAISASRRSAPPKTWVTTTGVPARRKKEHRQRGVPGPHPVEPAQRLREGEVT